MVSPPEGRIPGPCLLVGPTLGRARLQVLASPLAWQVNPDFLIVFNQTALLSGCVLPNAGTGVFGLLRERFPRMGREHLEPSPLGLELSRAATPGSSITTRD